MAIERLRVVGANAQQRVVWMSLFVPGVRGRRGLPYILVGPPGTGKTSIVEQLVHTAGMHGLTLLGSVRSPIDYLGTPFLRKQNVTTTDADFTEHTEEVPYTHYAPPGWALELARAGRSCVNYDELNTAPLAVQSAMLRVLFEGVVGEFPLPTSVRQLACMNPVGQATGGRDLSMALQNRLGHIDWPTPTVEEFARHMLGGGQLGQFVTSEGDVMTAPVDPAVEETNVDRLWAQAWPRALGEVTGFLKRRPEFLLKLPTSPGKAWPSLRTWEFKMRALAGSYVYDLSPAERLIACSAFIGDSAYAEFFQWLKEADLPDPEALLDGSVHFEHAAQRIDRTAAVLASCTALVTPEGAPKRKERIDALWRILRDVPDGALDVALPSVTALCQARVAQGNATAYKMLARLEPVMTAAGLVRA